MKTIIKAFAGTKAFPERFPAKDGATKPRDRA
jgi:hypothetical protein